MSEWEMPEIIAIQKWVAKKIPNYSTGIDESLTCGYGELDELGFWEYPLPPEFHGKVPAQEHELKLLREAVGLISTLKPDMVIDALDPLGIARQVEAHVQAERDAMQKRVRELEEELDAHTEMLTDVWKRAIKMWQDETGRTDTWPDGAQHYAYLMGKITELEAENERLRLLEIELMEYKTIPGRVGRPTYLYEEAIDAAKRNAGGKHE